MKAGQTNLEVGQRVKITGIKGRDAKYNGKQGVITHPFSFGQKVDPQAFYKQMKGWAGIQLDAGYSDLPWGGQINIQETEVELTHQSTK